VPLQADWALGTRQAIGIHTGAGRQCADAIEAGVSADRPEHIHTGTESGDLGQKKGGDGAAYECLAAWAEPLATTDFCRVNCYSFNQMLAKSNKDERTIKMESTWIAIIMNRMKILLDDYNLSSHLPRYKYAR